MNHNFYLKYCYLWFENLHDHQEKTFWLTGSAWLLRTTKGYRSSSNKIELTYDTKKSFTDSHMSKQATVLLLGTD